MYRLAFVRVLDNLLSNLHADKVFIFSYFVVISSMCFDGPVGADV